MDDDLNKIIDNAVAKFSYIPRHVPNMKTTNNEEVLIVNSGLQSDMFNIICPTQFITERSKNLIDKAVRKFIKSGLPFACWLYDAKKIVVDIVNGLDLDLIEKEIGMVLDYNNFNTESDLIIDIEFRSVREKEDLHIWKSIIKELIPGESLAVDGFFDAGEEVLLLEDSNLKHYIGFVDARPVATSSIFMNKGVAGIWDVVTLPKYRGKGIGTQMTYLSVLEGMKQSCELSVLSATDAGAGIYKKLGFVKSCDIDIYGII